MLTAMTVGFMAPSTGVLAADAGLALGLPRRLKR